MFLSLYERIKAAADKALKQRKLNQERVVQNQGPYCREAKKIDKYLEKKWGIGSAKKKLRYEEMKELIKKFVRREGCTLPDEYQYEGIFRVKEFKIRAIIGDEPGLGKTLMALYTILLNDWLSTIVVVCPANVKYEWKMQAKVHCGLSASVISGTTVPRRGIVSHPRIIIINYDILGEWLDALKALQPDLVIFDEIHRLGNKKIDRFKNAKGLARVCKCVLGLSGTLIQNKVSEAWGPLNLVRPDLYPSYEDFCNEYSNATLDFDGSITYKGGKNLDKLHEEITDHLYIRRRFSQVFPGRKASIRHIRLVKIRDRKQYEHARDNFLDWLKVEDPTKVAAAKRAAGLTKIGYLIRLVAKLKRRQCRRFIDRFMKRHPGEKIIIFGVHKKMVRGMYEKYKPKALYVDGSVRDKMRHDTFQKFRKDKRHPLIFCNIQAAGEGWNGEVAKYTLMLQLPWKPGALLQAEKRTDRKTQTRRCINYYLIAHNTIEERLCQINEEKQAVSDAVLDGAKTSDGIDIYSRLIDGLKEEAARDARRARRRKRKKK